MNESCQNNSLVNNQNCNVQIHRRIRSAIPQILHSCSMIGNVIQADVVMFIQQTCCSDSYQSDMVIIHTYYFAIIYNELPVTCIRGHIIWFPKHPSMPFFYIHAGTHTLGFDPLSVLYSPLQKEVQAACERPTQKRWPKSTIFFSALFSVLVVVREVRFNGHGVLNNLTFHRYNCGRCHTSDFSAMTFQLWHLVSSD